MRVLVLTELPLREPIGDGYRDVTDVDIIAVRFRTIRFRLVISLSPSTV